MNWKLGTRLIVFTLAVLLIVSTVIVPAQAAMPPIDRTFTLYMVPNTHLDTAWQSPYKQVVQGNGNNGLQPMFNTAISKLNSDPSYIFTTSASKHFEWIKEYYDADNPDPNRRYWPEVKRLVEAGQWDITGGQVVEPDLNIPSGESLARQSLYAQHFFEREFGRDKQPTAGMVPDVFGFAGQIPQILYKSEMPYFITSKINWNEKTGLSAYKEDPSSGDNYWRNHRGNDDVGTTHRGRESDLWWWQGLDGKTSVLADFMCYDYNWNSTRGPIEAIFEQNWQDGHETGIKLGMLFYGSGDFGQGLRGDSGDNSFAYVNEVRNDPDTKYSVVSKGATAFFDDLMDVVEADKAAVAGGADPAINIPTHTGEMYFEYHRGTYTSWARIKEYNRKNEILAESSEKAATLGFYTGSVPTNSSDKIEWAWNRVLTDQMHDVLPGSSVAYQYYQSYNFQEQSANLFNSVRDNALGALAYRADTNTSGKPVFVYNELSWARDGEVTVELKYDGALPAGIQIFDGTTELFASKVVRNEAGKTLTITFLAKDVPAVGYKVFDVREGTAPAHNTTLRADPANLTFENEFLKMKINPATGYISSLMHHESGDNWREMFVQGVGTEGAELHVYKDTEERPDQGFDQWELNAREMNKEPDWIIDGPPKSIEVIENTPEKVTIRVVKEWNGCDITQEFSLFAGVDRVEVNLNADWYQVKRLLKVSFPIAANTDYATYETSFGAVQRPTDRITPFQQARYEVPGHKWIDVTDKSGAYGVSILNDAKYGFDSWRKTIDGKTFVRSRITVCRTPRAQSFASNSAFNPSSPYVIDSGVHNFNYAIAPHTGGWESANTVNKGYEINTPMKSFEAAKGPSQGLGSSESFAGVDKPNVVMSALKNQYDNQGDRNTVVVRVYEATGKDTDGVTITLPGNVVSAKEVNILEHSYDSAHGYEDYVTKAITTAGNTIRFDIGKYEIVTFEVKLTAFAQPPLAAAPQRAVDLDAYYNQRATAPRSDRRAAFLEGDGTAVSPGFSIPDRCWPESGLDFQGITFDVGPKAANNIVSGAAATNVAVTNPAVGYSKAYIVGFSTARTSNTIVGNAGNGACAATGTLTINYASGAPTAKEITFNSWRTDLSGWDRYNWMDTKPYVYDTIVHVNTFLQQSTSAAASADHLTNENFLFLYAIDVDKGRAISSINLPANSDIKIVAITLADPVPGFGVVYDGAASPSYTDDPPSVPTNVTAGYDPLSNNLKSYIKWDKVDNAVEYRVYGAKTEDFTVGTSTQLGDTGNNYFVHALPLGVSPADAAAGNDKYYYKVVAINRSAVMSDPSAVTGPVTISNIDYCVGITNGAANPAIVNQGGQQSATLAGWKTTNGVWATANDKWSHNGLSSGTGWLSVRVGFDGALKEIRRFILAHGNMNPDLSHSGANKKFSIWYSNDSTDGSPDAGNWTQLFDVTDNYSAITVHELNAPLAVDWVQIRIPADGGYQTAEGASGANFNTAWLYEFCAAADNPNLKIGRAQNPSISFTPHTVGGTMTLEANYGYLSPAGGAAEGATTYKWFKRVGDSYNAVYLPIAGAAGKTLTQTNVEVGETEGYKCDVALFDSNGNAGQSFTIEADAPLSTIRNGAITPSLASGGVNLALSYEYYNALNYDEGQPLQNPPKKEAAQYQWYKKTAVEIDGKFEVIPGATGKTLFQTRGEVIAAETFRCKVYVFDTDGARGQVVDVDLDASANQLRNAAVDSESVPNAARMVDGLVTTKWEAATSTNPCPHTAVFDMGAVKVIDRFRAFHAPAYRELSMAMSRYSDTNPAASTYDFDISHSTDNVTWVTERVRTNTAPITDIRLGAAVTARYVKITVITPNASLLAPTNWDPTNRIRIIELEALASIVEILPPSASLYENGMALSLDAALGKTVDVKVDALRMPAGKVNLIAAAYNNDGVLLQVRNMSVDIDALGIIDCVIPGFAVSPDTKSMKVFLWTQDTLLPIADAVPVN